MILKILVAIWFLKMLILPFSKNFLFRTVLKSCGEDLNKINLTKDTDIKELSYADKTTIVTHSITMVGMFLWEIMIYVVDFIIMLLLLKHDNTYITLAFIILSILDLLMALIKSKMGITKNKNKSTNNIGLQLLDIAKELERTICKKAILRIINILYWGYAVYLLFF